MHTKKDYIRAAAIAHAIDADVRGRVIDAFVDYFRGENPRFDVVRFEVACKEGALISAATIRKNKDML